MSDVLLKLFSDEERTLMFGNVARTGADLNFSLFGIPVRVNPFFWLLSALLGWRIMQTPGLGPAYLGIWIACVFFSILIHELGHAALARYYGWPPEIVLYQFGGLAIFTPHFGYTRSRSILISLAGPAAGFVLYGVVEGVLYLLRHSEAPVRIHPMVGFALLQLVWINLWWGLLNLLPIHPLDGGQVCREICTKFSPYNGMGYCLKIGIVLGAAIGLWFLSQERTYAGIMFLFLAFENFQALQSWQRRY